MDRAFEDLKNNLQTIEKQYYGLRDFLKQEKSKMESLENTIYDKNKVIVNLKKMNETISSFNKELEEENRKLKLTVSKNSDDLQELQRKNQELSKDNMILKNKIIQFSEKETENMEEEDLTIQQWCKLVLHKPVKETYAYLVYKKYLKKTDGKNCVYYEPIYNAKTYKWFVLKKSSGNSYKRVYITPAGQKKLNRTLNIQTTF